MGCVRIDVELEEGASTWLPEARIGGDGIPYIEVDGVRLELPPHHRSRNFSAGDSITFFVQFGSGVAAGVVANFLYDWLKTRKIHSLRIEGREVSEKNEIERALDE